MPRTAPRRLLAPVLAALAALVAAAPALAAPPSATVSGVGALAYKSKGPAYVFSDPTLGIKQRAGQRTIVAMPAGAFVVHCLSNRPLARCVRAAAAAPGRTRLRLKAPIGLASVDASPTDLTIANARSFSLSIQGCGVLRLRGKGSYTIGSGTPVAYAFTRVTAVRIPCRGAFTAAAVERAAAAALRR